MAGGRDLTTTIKPEELTRIRALLAENPPMPVDPDAIAEYPRMLYHSSYLENQQAWKDEADPLKKKLFVEKMKVAVHIVTDVDEEMEFLADGWKHSPADFLDPSKDPRVPVGREARKNALSQRLSREDEIRNLTLRLAELTGRPLSTQIDALEPGQTLVAKAGTYSEAPRAKRAYTKRKRRITRRRPSQVAAARAAVGDTEPPEQS